MPLDSPILSHALHMDMYLPPLPPYNPYILINLPPSLGRKVERNPVGCAAIASALGTFVWSNTVYTSISMLMQQDQ